MPRRALAIASAVATVVLAPGGCGRRTDVKPPQFVAPEAIQKLAATNESKGIRLTWERPDEHVDGSTMGNLAAFRIERSVAGGPFLALKKVEVTDRDRFRQIRHFRLLDVGVNPGERYRYRVVSFTSDGYVSGPSNIVEIQRVLPPPPTLSPKKP